MKHQFKHYFSWGNNPKRATMKGRLCRITASGKMGSCEIEFENGRHEIVSRRSLRKARACFICGGDGVYSCPESSGVDGSDGWYECDNCGGTGYVVP